MLVLAHADIPPFGALLQVRPPYSLAMDRLQLVVNRPGVMVVMDDERIARAQCFKHLENQFVPLLWLDSGDIEDDIVRAFRGYDGHLPRHLDIPPFGSFLQVFPRENIPAQVHQLVVNRQGIVVVVNDQVFAFGERIEHIEYRLVPQPGLELLDIDDIVVGLLHVRNG